MYTLLKFSHGLGDAVQLTCVLRHLKKYRPDWTVDVAAQIGKHTAYAGLCRRSYVMGREQIDESQYRRVFDLGWYECYSVYSDSPCTKVCNCLREVFGIRPDLELLKYRIQVGEQAHDVTRRYLAGICNHTVAELARVQTSAESAGDPNSDESSGTKSEFRNPKSEIPFPVVAIHYQSNTSAHKKDLSHQVVAELCREILRRDHIPLILDWDRRSPLPDQKTIFCPGVGAGDLWDNIGTGDAERVAALIDQCALFIGVDSGPLHVAGATETPALGVWRGHSPLQFYDLCDNVTHLVPERWRDVPPCQHGHAAKFFDEHYAYRTYRGSSGLSGTLIESALELLNGTAAASGRQPRPIRGNGIRENSERRQSIGILTNSASGNDIRAPPAPRIQIPASKTRGPNSQIRNHFRGLPMMTATALTWELLPGLAHEIALGADGSAWCLGMGEMPSGGGYSIHRWNGSGWDHIDGAAAKIAIGRGVGFQPAGDRVFGGAPEPIWILNHNGEILRSCPAGWEALPGRARELAVGANGDAWCVSAADFAPGGGSLHVWNGHDWDHVDGGAAVKIAVGRDGQPWIINSAGNIFRRSGEGFELLTGLAREIAIGVDGSAFCLSAVSDSSGDSSIHAWNGHDWEHVPGAAVKIAAGPPGAVWLVNSQHQIFRSA